MFKAAFAATRFFDFATNRRTFKMRSGAYAHSRKLHGLSSGVTDWTGTTDVDNATGRVGTKVGQVRRRYSNSSAVQCV
jgi:hypothetical protein